MNKNEIIKDILKKVYNDKSNLIVSEKDVDYINEYYKNNFEKVSSYDDLCGDAKFNDILKKLHSAQYEIKKQLQIKKALQPGIIAECNFSESLAKVLKLNKVIDLDNAKYDITYRDDGKLIPSEKIKKELNVLILLIDSFNENTDIFSEIGHNYNSFDKDTCIVAANMYIESKGIDLIISSVEGNIVAITGSCFKCKLANGKFAVSLKGSEIRTSGKNSKKVWTKEHFNGVLKKLNAKSLEGTKVFVEKNDDIVEYKKARGKSQISRFKISNIYYLKVEDVKEKDNGFVFDLNNVRQLLPTISMHMYIEANKNELKQLLIE